MKRIIVYRWNSNSEEAVLLTMQQMGFQVTEFDRKIRDYHADAEFAREFMECIHREKAEIVFSYNYFPIISSVCEINKIPYISWIYDCPLYTLNSLTVKNAYNYIFCFDAAYTARLCERGAKNCFHMPLGVDVQGFERVIANAGITEKTKFSAAVSFVGSLYNDEKNRLRDTCFDAYMNGYLEGIITAQKNIYGYNFIEKVLTEEAAEEIAGKSNLQLGKMYTYTDKELAAAAVNMEITAREREEVLRAVSQIAGIDLYTGSEVPEYIKDADNIRVRGYADNKTEMPLIFSESRINLNVTSKSIESGIPLRVLDILACGGFCITNYQPEVAELLTDGEELVMYTDEADLLYKISYYMEHEEKRAQIAQNGKEAVALRFSLKARLGEMFSVVENDISKQEYSVEV